MAKVRAALNIRFQGSVAPKILFTDRGQGFYDIKGGKITNEYKAALQENGLRAYYKEDASEQAGNLQEVMLHETAVAWVRNREKVTQPKEPWKETTQEFAARLRSICQYINDHYDVDGLCKEFPQRLQAIVNSQGDRINK